LMACGLDPNQCILYPQSLVAAHTELHWILSCLTPVGWLTKLPQYKEKTQQYGTATLGLLSYPVLMAADILLFRSTSVPVGWDQIQHVELSRDIAQSFNYTFNTHFFPIPVAVFSEGKTCKVMSLKDGSSKMSKSKGSDNTRINLTDTDDQISTKIARATTDSLSGVSFDPINRPELANLVTIYSGLSGFSVEEVSEQFRERGHAEFKKSLSEVVVGVLRPIRLEIEKLNRDIPYVESILQSGAERANHIANSHIQTIKKITGLL